MSSISSPVKGRAWTRDLQMPASSEFYDSSYNKNIHREEQGVTGGCCFIICSAYMQGCSGHTRTGLERTKGSGGVWGRAAELIRSCPRLHLPRGSSSAS